MDGSFIGVVKCDVTPPNNLYIPLLPETKNGKLLFHLNPMTGTCLVQCRIEEGPGAGLCHREYTRWFRVQTAHRIHKILCRVFSKYENLQ